MRTDKHTTVHKQGTSMSCKRCTHAPFRSHITDRAVDSWIMHQLQCSDSYILQRLSSGYYFAMFTTWLRDQLATARAAPQQRPKHKYENNHKGGCRDAAYAPYFANSCHCSTHCKGRGTNLHKGTGATARAAANTILRGPVFTTNCHDSQPLQGQKR